MPFTTRLLNVGRQFVMQLTVSVAATVCVAAMFASTRAPAPAPASVVADSGKSIRRVADGAVETTTLRLDPQYQAAMASLASFTPTVAPPTAPPPVVASRVPARPVVAVMPPPRPTFVVATAATRAPEGPALTTAVPSTPIGWRVAGFEIPGSARVKKLVPTGDDLLHTGSVAWKASTDAARKVAGLTSFLGL